MTTTPTKTAADGTEEFDWIQLSMDLQDPGKEEFVDKFWRKVKSNPFVPIGAFGATGALIYGLYSMKNNDSRMSQLMMRTRIGAQAFAIVALVTGLILANPLPPKNK